MPKAKSCSLILIPPALQRTRNVAVIALSVFAALMALLLLTQPADAANKKTKPHIEPTTQLPAEATGLVSEAGASQMPADLGPYCQTQDSSLIATMIPSDVIDMRLLCASNGKDFIHRFVKTQDFSREHILDDYRNKMSEEFQIPENLRKRVGFWFDIYTKYPSHIRILHHAKYPWIQFREYDLTDFLVQPKVQWMNIQAAEKFVAREKARIVAQLNHMAKMKNYDNLQPDEHYLFQLLEEIPGSRKKVFLEAARDIRVQTGQMDFFVEGLMRKSQYLDTMEEVFRDSHLPTELARLPLVESSFNPYAVSKVGAAGIWQFMTSTGRAYMKVNDQIDERRSPIKSTIGAARYLAATNRMLYHSWPLTIVAYNHGPGGVRKAVRLAKSDDIGTVIERYESKTFNFASKNYFPEFLAALYAEKYQREIFGRIQQMDRIEFESIRLQKAIRPSKLAKQMQLPLEVILGYNLDLKTSIERDLPVPAGYTLNLPVGYGVKIGQSQANTHAQRIAARSK